MATPAGRVTNDPTNYIAIGLQSAKDIVASTFYFLKHLDGSGYDVTIDQSSERIGGAGREIGLRYRTKVTADGQYVSYADPDFLGRVLYAALGSDAVTAGASNASLQLYSHALNSGASQLPYQTVEQGWADTAEWVVNCVVTDCKLEGEAGKPVKVTAQFISGGTPHGQANGLSPVREGNTFPFMVPGGSVAITATGNLTLGGGASSLQVTKWSVDIKNTVDDAIQTTALNREDVLWLNADYDLDGTFKYINADFWDAVQYGGGSTVPTGLLTSGNFNFFTSTPSGVSVRLFAPYVEFTALKVNRLDPDGKTMYIDFTGSSRNIGSQALQCTVVNTTAGVYSNTAT